jgi:hypothetical protein
MDTSALNRLASSCRGGDVAFCLKKDRGADPEILVSFLDARLDQRDGKRGLLKPIEPPRHPLWAYPYERRLSLSDADGAGNEPDPDAGGSPHEIR